MKYVIIGNGAAAVGAIEGIRKTDKTGEIIVISDERHHTYSRPLISYYLEGKTDTERMKYRPDNFYSENDVQTIFGKKAAGIDSSSKTVTLDDGEKIGYDRLLIATGSSPFIPPCEGFDKVKNSYTFMKLDDALALERAVVPGSRVLIVGAGLIGLKCAEGIAGRAGSITVIDMSPRILSSILDDECAQVVQAHIEKKGIRFMLGDSVVRYEENKAFLKSGQIVDFDILVTAVGVRPNISLVSQAGGKVGRGILTGCCMETSIKDVYAAGDCTESCDIVTGQSRIIAIMPNAYMQGECAGVNMAGSHQSFDGAVAMNAIGFFGLHLITAGSYTGSIYEEHESDNIKKLYYDDNRLLGFILVGNVNRAGIYTSLIRSKIPLDSIDFELVKKNPSLMAFQQNNRRKILGDVI